MSEVEIKKTKNKLARFNLLLILLILVGIGAVGYYGFYFWQDTESKINRLNLATKIILVENSKTINNLDKRVDALQSNLSLMSSSKVEVYQVSELIALANQVLVVYGDVNGALRLLNFAQSQLSANNNSIFDNLKKSLGYDIATLSRANVIDKVALSGEIDSLSDGVLALHLESIDTSIKPQINLNDTKLHKFLNNIKDTLYSVVSISRTHQKEILLPTNEDIAKANIRFDLLSAKIALFNHNQKSWIYNLQNASSEMNTYFYEYAGFNVINAKLMELMQINVATDGININETIDAVNKIKAMQN